MRVAVLILGLILGALMFFQTVLVGALSGVASNLDTQNVAARASGDAAAMGVAMALLWLVACALVIPVPVVSAVFFSVAGLVGIANAKAFPDLQVWGVISFVLAAMSVIGWFGKRRSERREATRHEELVALQRAAADQAAQALSQVQMLRNPSSAATGGLPELPCAACGALNAPAARFCHACGTAMAGAIRPVGT